MTNKAELENKRLVAECVRHQRRLRYSYPRAPWTGPYLGVDTIEEDNARLRVMIKVYAESTHPQEANDKLEAMRFHERQWSEEE